MNQSRSMEDPTSESHAREVSVGARFEFGKNWRDFLENLDDERIAEAEHSLRSMLELNDLRGLRFLDAGSGSGLFSLAARRLGATVCSFDYDPDSVAATRSLQDRFFPGDDGWVVLEGSVLDRDFLATLGSFDVVYSWGVLHHTGAMWSAIDNVTRSVGADGRLFIAIYNHQVYLSSLNLRMKKAYVSSGPVGKRLLLGSFAAFQVAKGVGKDLLLRRSPTQRYRDKKKSRGMSMWFDWKDWVGGYPFEVARPEEVFDFCKHRGFRLARMKTCGSGMGCNEFVFQREGAERLDP